MNLFENNGAALSPCHKYRYARWCIWDEWKPKVMFIGNNPSTTNEEESDNTIKRVARISNFNRYGGFYMMNCFPSTRVLYLNMMHVWNFMFLPATWAMVTGLLGFAFVVFHFNWVDYLRIIIIGFVAYKLYNLFARPHLGAED